jgi:L,D-transpeptidase catalytic domain
MRSPTLWVAMLALLLLSTLLSACASQTQISQAHANKTKLDQELNHARTDLGIPDRLLAPVTGQEKKVADGDGGLTYDYDNAAKTYTALYNQLLAIEQSAPQTLNQQAQQDMQAFATILNQRRGEGFTEVSAYQARYDAAQQAYADAKTPGDYAHVSDIATAQTRALEALWPAYQKLQDLKTVIKWLTDTGVGADQAQHFYDRDLAVFRDAATAERYQALTSVIDAQIVQSQADAATAQPYIADSLLTSFQARIDLLKQYVGGFQSSSQLDAALRLQYGNQPTADTFQKQHDDAAAKLTAAHQPSDYTAVTTAITQQNTAMTSLLIRAKALYDYKQFDTLVRSDAVWKRTIINKQPDPRFHSGTAYPLAYEYIGEDGLLDNDIGIGPASKPETYARTDPGFQSADFRITSLMANLRAMLDNYDPATDEVNALDDAARINPVHEKPHATDLQLMQYYNVTGGKVIMISLREQVARFYDKGSLVGYTYVTTGDLDVPSVPGFWTAINRHSPDDPNNCSTHPITCPRETPGGNPIAVPPGFGDVFTPPVPGEYNPTPIHYDIAYHEGGFWLHDAYWRHQLGPETNLPHYDPNAFSGGSHGCVNISYPVPVVGGRQVGWNMQQVYNWTPLGTPIILY